ncbi:MAG: 5-formyltetrahydrofolate cyclo-ligase [Rhizorhabdus sp.]
MAANPAKAAMRAGLRAARDGFVLDLAPGERARLEARAAGHLMPLIGDAACVAFYMALGSELGCGPAIDAVTSRGIATVLPYVESPAQAMRFVRWTPGEPLIPGWRGLLQPAADAAGLRPDIVIVPLLGFDSALGRLGQGAGFYDRALAGMGEVKKIGFGWSVQQCSAIALDSWDVPLDAVVTEAGVIGGRNLP